MKIIGVKKIKQSIFKNSKGDLIKFVSKKNNFFKSFGEVYFNEINTIPGSFSYYLWEHSKLNFSELLDQLIETALTNHQQKNGRILSYDTNLLSEKAASGIKGLKGTK